jgi:hypothetical protein
MAYGDYDGPDKPDKGKEGGSCNRRLCQAPNAIWWNHGSHSWYCGDCARDIGEDSFNKRDWELRWQPTYGHPMFETREQMDARGSLDDSKAADIAAEIHAADWLPMRQERPG